MAADFDNSHEALAALAAWCNRQQGRYFEICHANPEPPEETEHRWSIRVEYEPASWSHDAEGFTFFGNAVANCLRAARKAGYE
jgi:predicted TIM-barrel fold metal-dependent hydrolase